MVKKIVRRIEAPQLSDAELQEAYLAVRGDYEAPIRNLFAACDEKAEMYRRVTAAVHYLIDQLDEVMDAIEKSKKEYRDKGDKSKLIPLQFFYDSLENKRADLLDHIVNSASIDMATATIAEMRAASDIGLLSIPEVPAPAEPEIVAEAAPAAVDTPVETPAAEETPVETPAAAAEEKATRKSKKAK